MHGSCGQSAWDVVIHGNGKAWSQYLRIGGNEDDIHESRINLDGFEHIDIQKHIGSKFPHRIPLSLYHPRGLA
jgi:hypothetical protein